MNTLATQMHHRLREALLAGRLAPGARLKVQALAAEYGVGATPVREALSTLSAEGLVVRLEQRGFRAAQVSLEEFEELLRTRVWTEGLALREAIRAGDLAWEEQLVVAHHRLARTPRLDPLDRVWEAQHVLFHQSLVAACPSRPLLEFLGQLRDRAGRYRAISRAYPGRHVSAEHEAIANATLARDEGRAVALLEDHYRRTGDYLRNALGG